MYASWHITRGQNDVETSHSVHRLCLPIVTGDNKGQSLRSPGRPGVMKQVVSK